jgi:GntR family transcriptional regulator/MocR family aminotransferase
VVSYGVKLAPDAILAIVTPGQQAPTGVTLSAARRRALLQWASRAGTWIIEDDYLSELQLSGRSAPALAADDPNGRVIHIGSFGKTLSPALGLGFLVAPLQLAERFGEVAACLQPAPNSTTQLALATFIADGHYLRHLRHMKKLYSDRRDALIACLGNDLDIAGMSGLALIVRVPGGDDKAMARAALEQGIAPMPMSVWHHNEEDAVPGLMLSVTNLRKGHLEQACDKLKRLIRDASPG